MGSIVAGESTPFALSCSADLPKGRVTRVGRPLALTDVFRRMGYAAHEPVEETSLWPRQSTYFASGLIFREPRLRGSKPALTLTWPGDRRDEPAGRSPTACAGGWRWTRPLAHRPDLALLDEPSAGLGPDRVAVGSRRRSAPAPSRPE